VRGCKRAPRGRSAHAHDVAEQLAGEVMHALGGPAPAVAQVRVDRRAAGVAVDRRPARVDEAATHDAGGDVDELGDAARVALENDGDEVGGIVADRLVEDEEIAGARRLGRGAEAARLGGPRQELGAGGRGQRRAERARPGSDGGERIA